MDSLTRVFLYVLGPAVIICQNLNPFASFSGMTFEPATDFSATQGAFFSNPHIPASTGNLYPFLTEDHVAKAFGMNGNTGIKYPVVPFASPKPDASGLRVSTTRQRGPPPAGMGRGKPPPGGRPKDMHVNSHNSYRQQMNHQGTQGRNGLRDVTLDIRGGGYKIERPRNTRPYKPPSAETTQHEIRGRIKGNRNTHVGRESSLHPRNRRPNKPHRPRMPPSRNPYNNAKNEAARPPVIPTAVEFESPENVLPFNPKLYKQMQEMMKFGPRFQQANSRGAFSAPSYTGGLNIAGGSGSPVKSSSMQMYPERNIQEVTASPYSSFNNPYTLVSGEKFTGQLNTFQQPQAEKTLEYSYFSQDPKLNTGVAQTQSGQDVFQNVQQSFPDGNIQAYGNPSSYYQTEPFRQTQKDVGSHGNLFISGYSSSSFPASGYSTAEQPSYYGSSQSLVVPGVSGPTQFSHSTPNPALDYKQLMLNNQQKVYDTKQTAPSTDLKAQLTYQEPSKLNYPMKTNNENYQVPPDLAYRPYSENFASLQGIGVNEQATSQASVPQNENIYSYSKDAVPSYSTKDYPTRIYSAGESSSYSHPGTHVQQLQSYAASPYQMKEQASVSGNQNNKFQPLPSLEAQEQANYGASGHSVHTESSYPYQESTTSYQSTNPPREAERQYDGTDTKQSKISSNYDPSSELFYQQTAHKPQTAKPDTLPSDTKSQTVSTATASTLSTTTYTLGYTEVYENLREQDEHKSGSDVTALQIREPESIYLGGRDHDRYFYQHDDERKQSTRDTVRIATSSSKSVPSRRRPTSKAEIANKRKHTFQASRITSTVAPDIPKIPPRRATSQPTGYSVQYRTSTRRNKATASPADRIITTRAPSSHKYASSYVYHFSPLKTSVFNRTTNITESKSEDSPETSETLNYHETVTMPSTTEEQTATIISVVTATDTVTPAQSSSTMPTEKKTQNETPLCALHSNTTFCLQDPEYPTELIKKAIERNRHPLDKFLVDISPSTNLILDSYKSNSQLGSNEDFGVMASSSSVSYSFEGSVITPAKDDGNNSIKCLSTVRYSKPLRALNTAGQWKIIVNVEFVETGANYTQSVRIEECSHIGGTLATCGGETISACLQQFKLYRLLAWDPEKGFYIDAFLLPASCFCGSHRTSD